MGVNLNSKKVTAILMQPHQSFYRKY